MTVSDDVRAPAGTSDDPFEGLPLLITIPRAAALLGVSRASAYRYAADGELPTRRLGGRIYLITAGIRALVEEDPNRGEVA